MHVVHGPAVRCEKETQILKCQPNKIYLNPSGLSPDPVSTVLLHQGNVEPPQHLRAKFPFLPRVYFELLPVKHVLYCVLPNVFFFFFFWKGEGNPFASCIPMCIWGRRNNPPGVI